MGSRASSDLIYGIAWDEGECSDQDLEWYDLCDEIEEDCEEIVVGTWACEMEDTRYLGIKETHQHGDWDEPEIIDISKINKIADMMIAYNETLFKICEKFKLNYKEPKLIMLSTWS